MIDQVILRIALPKPLRRLFDYLPPETLDNKQLIPGIRVKVPFLNKALVGILVEIKHESSVSVDKLKKAYALLDDQPIFTEDIYKLCEWASDYYHYPLGEILSHALPSLLRQGKSDKAKRKHALEIIETSDTQPELNPDQAKAVDAINALQNKFQVFLLDGVTGSGKTEVYLRAIASLQSNKQVLVLVPEISLTPQTFKRFRSRFKEKMVALHSGLSEQERLQAWMGAKSGEIKMVIGTRSAIFTPFLNLGLIIVDEEHDQSFKQQDRFRYHARDLAIMRAKLNQIPIVLGSATPSLESCLNVKRNRYVHLSLPNRAGPSHLPTYQIIDLKQGKSEGGLSPLLLKMMRDVLDEDNQVLLFLNRRGFAPVLYCAECAFIAGCSECDARLVYHRHPPHLQCHHCHAKCKIPEACAKCASTTLLPIGLGTQRLELTLSEHFPHVPIVRVDRDNTRRKGALEDLLNQINTEKKAILLGTQMLAKGHHFPRVTLVGITDGDRGLFSPDFRAAEFMGQLLLQVSGRAGRAEKKGTVVIQTRYPEHPLLQTLIHEGYQSFSEKLLIERKETNLPPCSYFSLFRAEGRVEKEVNDFLIQVKAMSETITNAVSLMGPVPAIIAKRKALYCQHLLVRANKRSALQQFLKTILPKIETLKSRSVKWIIDVDPIEV
jgi:primosomal protein N' (replication factor Y)